MAGPMSAFHLVAHSHHFDRRYRRAGVDLGHVGCEQHIGSVGGSERHVSLLVTGVGLEIPFLVELGGVDEQGHDHRVASISKKVHETEMTLMEVAQRGQ
jgi:hypothetical protein